MVSNSPLIDQALVAAVVAVATVFIKAWFDRRNIRDKLRAGDQEHLSKSEQRFRQDLIAELQKTKDYLSGVENRHREEIAELEEKLNVKTHESLERDRKISHLEWAVERLCYEIRRLAPDLDISFCTEITREEHRSGGT